MWVAAKCGFTSAAVPVTTQGGSLNLSGLREPFPADKVKQRKGGGGKMLDYVAIETFLERLLDVAPDYTIENANTYFKDDGTAVASLELVIAGKRGYGVGAMKNPDPDMALKSAVPRRSRTPRRTDSASAWSCGTRSTARPSTPSAPCWVDPRLRSSARSSRSPGRRRDSTSPPGLRSPRPSVARLES